ncbi:MAG: HD domain-containing protein [Rhodocyclaceae bacterium]|nr:HD domain-containing protein [Rhodocyclaceae bacterium]
MIDEIASATDLSEEERELAITTLVAFVQSYIIQGNMRLALDCAHAGYAISTGAANLFLKRRMLNVLGMIHREMGAAPIAISYLAQAVALAQQIGDQLGECAAWANYAGVAISIGDHPMVGIANAKVLGLSAAIPAAKILRMQAHQTSAQSLYAMGKYQAGIAAINNAIAEQPEAVTPFDHLQLARTQNTRSALLVAAGELAQARDAAFLAGEHAQQAEGTMAQAEADIAQSRVDYHSKQFDVAESRLLALINKVATNSSVKHDVYNELANLYEAQGDNEKATKYRAKFFDLYSQTKMSSTLEQLSLLTHLSPHQPAQRHEDTVAKIELVRERKEIFRARIETMEHLAVAAELRDDSTGEHSYRVGRMACLLAKEAGCDDDTIAMIDIAARLHDIGKIGVPDSILLKPRGFNAAERQVMEMHAEIGADVLAKSKIPQIKMAEEIARHHHERWDGRGYPAKIGSREIPFAARITALADVFDALTHKRPYKEAWTVEASLSEILALRGQHFDPELTDLFLGMVSRLRREQGDLDHYLGVAARASPFLQARGKIWETLRHAKDEYQVHAVSEVQA